MSEEELNEAMKYNLDYTEAMLSDELFGGNEVAEVKLLASEKAIKDLQQKVEQKDKEIDRLNNIIDTILEFSFLKEECPLNFGFGDEKEEKAQDVFYEDDYCEKTCNDDYKKCWLKYFERLQELKGSNEPSFEEMVGFVENVYKDIKSQSTLHEELEEERKTIAKIVGDFKEVNK